MLRDALAGEGLPSLQEALVGLVEVVAEAPSDGLAEALEGVERDRAWPSAPGGGEAPGEALAATLSTLGETLAARLAERAGIEAEAHARESMAYLTVEVAKLRDALSGLSRLLATASVELLAEKVTAAQFALAEAVGNTPGLPTEPLMAALDHPDAATANPLAEAVAVLMATLVAPMVDLSDTEAWPDHKRATFKAPLTAPVIEALTGLADSLADSLHPETD